MKQDIRRLFYGIMIGSALSGQADAQPPLRFEHLSVQQGLSDNSVFCILQDREGFMWIGTHSGLNKYDGYNFTSYNPEPNNPKSSLQHNFITDIHEDRKGRLWIETFDGGLHEINKKTGKITSYLVDSVKYSQWDLCISIYEDRSGIFWIGSHLGLLRFDPETKKFTKYPFAGRNNQHNVHYVTEDHKGRLWLGTKVGIYQFDRKTEKFISFANDSIQDKEQHWVISMFTDSDGDIWFGRLDNGLYRFDPDSEPIQFKKYNPNGLIHVDPSWNGMHEGKNGLLWLATNHGLQVIDKKTDKVFTYKSNYLIPGSLSTDFVACVYEDRTGNLWVGTNSGVNKMSSNAKPFHIQQVLPNSSIIRPDENNIQAVLEDKNGTVWANTLKGLYRLTNGPDSLTKAIPVSLKLSKDKKTGHTLFRLQVSTIYKDRSGRLWLGTSKGLHLFDAKSNRFILYPSQSSVNVISEDASGMLWIGGSRAGNDNEIAIFDPQSDEFKYYLYNPKDTTGFSGINDLLVSLSGDVFIATTTKGIIKFNPKSQEITYFTPAEKRSRDEINDRHVLDLYEDKKGIIWAGTNKGGLNRLDPTTNRFSSFTTLDGLPSNHITSIVGYDEEDLWIGTNKGISRFSPSTKKFHNFNENDGLSENQFNRGSVDIGKGRLLFGSSNGVTIIYPDQLKENRELPPVYITGFKVLEKSRALPAGDIELSHEENFFSFDFVALNYNASDKNQYAYLLVNVDKDWVITNRRFASYTNIAPGTYQFRVKAANNDGLWNEQATVINLTILPPWWRTWWAYTLYGACLVAAILLFDRFRRRQLIAKEKEKTRQKELEQAHEIEKAYNELKRTQGQLIQSEKMASLGELTAGIAHEIQNPLNFVNNFSEINSELIAEMQEEIVKGNLEEVKAIATDILENEQKINHHGKRADAIVKGMLQHSRTNTGQKELTDINELADEYLRLSYHGLRAKDKAFNATIKTDFDTSIGKINIIPQDIGRVLLNLYNNAFYTVDEKGKSGIGQYEPTVSIATKKQGEKVFISIKDNGNGIPKKLLDKIFQPFFTTKPTGQGTGLGLSLSYDIVKAHGGELKVFTTEGEGTTFTVQLPANHA